LRGIFIKHFLFTRGNRTCGDYRLCNNNFTHRP